jgi:hypothetical protein
MEVALVLSVCIFLEFVFVSKGIPNKTLLFRETFYLPFMPGKAMPLFSSS